MSKDNNFGPSDDTEVKHQPNPGQLNRNALYEQFEQTEYGDGDGTAFDPEQEQLSEEEITSGVTDRETFGERPGEEQPPVEEPPVEEPPVEQPPVEEGEYAAVDGMPEYIVRKGDELFMRKNVNGDISYEPLDKVQQSEQRYEAANRRFQEAADNRRALQQEREQFEAEKAAKTPTLPEQSDVVGDTEEQLKQIAQQATDKMINGSKEEVEETLTEFGRTLLRATQQPSGPTDVNPNEIVNQAVQQIRQEDIVKEAQLAWDAFVKNNRELAEDGNMVQLMRYHIDGVSEEHEDWGPSQVIQEAEVRLKDWLAKHGSVEPPEPEVDLNDRQQLKDELQPLPQSRSGKAPLSEEEEEELSEEEARKAAVNEMRATRGF